MGGSIEGIINRYSGMPKSELVLFALSEIRTKSFERPVLTKLDRYIYIYIILIAVSNP